MAGQLDSLFKSVAKQVVADLGSSFDSTITIQKKHRELITQVQVFILQQILLIVLMLLLSLFDLLKLMEEKEESKDIYYT